jgi:hypothetical protein
MNMHGYVVLLEDEAPIEQSQVALVTLTESCLDWLITNPQICE